jgi:hypothetical protein
MGRRKNTGGPVDPNDIKTGQPDNIWDGYIQTRQLPKVGQGVDLIGPDGTMVHTKCMGHHRFGLFKGVEIIAGDYGSEYLEMVVSYIRNRRNNLFDSLVMITGAERTGKSTIALQLARRLDPDFPLSSVCFKIGDFSKCINEAPDGSVIIFDESGFDMFNQEWWADFQKELIKKLLVIGVKQLVLILCVPHRMEINKKLRERRVAFWINVFTKGDGYVRGHATFRRGIGNEWEEETYWEGLAAFRFGPMTGQFWDEYGEIKRKFVDEVSAGTYHPGYEQNTSKAIETRNLAIDALRGRKMTQIEIANAVGLDQSVVSKILNREKETNVKLM